MPSNGRSSTYSPKDKPSFLSTLCRTRPILQVATIMQQQALMELLLPTHKRLRRRRKNCSQPSSAFVPEKICQIHCIDVLVDTDIAKTIVEYVAHAAIENLVLGASRRGFLKRLKTVDVPSCVSKGSPDFCTVYVISRSKISSTHNASRLASFTSPLLIPMQQMQEKADGHSFSNSPDPPVPRHMSTPSVSERTPQKNAVDCTEIFKSPFSRARGYNPNMLTDMSESDSDILFGSSKRPCTDIDPDPSGILFDDADSWRNSQVSNSSGSSFGSTLSWTNFSELSSGTDFSSSSVENDNVEAEIKRLKAELQKTMEMYSTACREALNAQQKAVEILGLDEEKRLEEFRLAEEAARLTAEQENQVQSSVGGCTSSSEGGRIRRQETS